MSALCLTVLPFRLRIAKLSKRALPAYSHALLEILSADSVSFFSFAESNDETISMISTLSALRKMPSGADFTVASERWRCLIVSEGEIVNASSSMICMVSEVLAKAGFSILYVSGATTDYVLVMDAQFDAAMSALTRSISVVVDAVEDAAIEEEEAAAVAAQEQDREAAERASLAPVQIPVASSPAAEAAAPSDAKLATDLSQASMRLQVLSDRLVLHTIPRRDIDVYFRKLLRLICFTGGPARVRFFSFLWLQDELSLILDAAAYLALISDSDGDVSVGGGSAPLPELWRAIRVVGEFGFTETGIVYALSAPLAARGVGVFYISTFKTDFIMVGEESLEETESILSQKFEFVKSP